MPVEMEKLKGLRPEIVSELIELNDQADQMIADADAIYQLAKEEGRSPTDDEMAQIEELMAGSVEKTELYDEKLKNEKLAVARSTIELGREHLETTIQKSNLFGQSPAATRVRNMRDRFFDDPKRGFEHSGSFYDAVISAGIPGNVADERLNRIRQEAAATGMSQGSGPDGGIAVPPSFRQEIWTGMQQMTDNLLEMTDQYTVIGDSLTMVANGETSRANGSRFGGVQGYWIGEAAQMTASSPKVRNLKLEPQELAVLVYMTDKLMRNAPALETYVRNAASEEILFLVSDAIINGNGVGQPLGLLSGGGTVSVAKETGQAAATITLENVNKMFSRMHARARNTGAVWFINQDCEPQLEALSAVVGTGGVPVYLPQGAGGPTITESPNARLKGRPVIPIEYCAALGTVGDIIFANLGYYATGLQGMMRDDMSIHVRFLFNETALRFLFAVDGQPWLNNPITPFKGTLTKSAYVTLATRA